MVSIKSIHYDQNEIIQQIIPRLIVNLSSSKNHCLLWIMCIPGRSSILEIRYKKQTREGWCLEHYSNLLYRKKNIIWTFSFAVWLIANSLNVNGWYIFASLLYTLVNELEEKLRKFLSHDLHIEQWPVTSECETIIILISPYTLGELLQTI